MPFLILFLLVLAAQPLPWPASPFGWGIRGSAIATAAAAATPVVLAVWLAGVTRYRLLAEPGNRERTIRMYHRGRAVHLLALVAGQFVSLGLFGWGWAVRQLGGADSPEKLPFGAELLLIAPFLLGLVLSWAGFYSAEQHLAPRNSRGEPYHGGRWGYVSFQARQYLTLIGLPLGLMITARGLQWLMPEHTDGFWLLLIPVGLVGAALVLAPWPLRLILGARPLPPGPIRDRLEAAARRLRFRYSDILLWDTRNGVANAMVAGPVPWVRYVFLSDRLLAELTPAEVEAVFGHEVGHVRHRHFLFYAAFMGLSVTTLVGLWMIAMNWLVPSEAETAAAEPAAAVVSAPVSDGAASWQRWESVPQMLLIGSYVFVVFGFLSRRCERQADVYGCLAVSCGEDCGGHTEAYAGPRDPIRPTGLCPTGIRTFISALDKVALVNGISRRRPGLLNAWLHGTIARRVEFLEGVLVDRRTERQFQRRLGLLKWVLLTVLVASLAALAAGQWEEIRPLVWPA
jgi:Zn-dependent protease with chaperone function